jgi:O-antigen/teichoic acid export membrane protein
MPNEAISNHEPKFQALAATIGKNTLFGVVARAAQVGTRLITVPVVIAHLGLGGYGIWSIIMTAAAYMRFGSVGIKSAFQKYVAEATGNGDFETANKLLSTGCAVMLALSIVGLVPIAFFSRHISIAAGVPVEYLGSTSKAITILAMIMVMSNVGAAFEAIIMGGHRIDLARKYTTWFTIVEAVAIIIVLQLGYGLVAMATVMATSEVGFVLSCYLASKRVLPQISVAKKYVTTTVLYELFRFAGSYQMVNVLEIVYVAILPVSILRVFGADASGVYALATRVASSAAMLPDAFLLPILSGGTMMHASGSADGMRRLIAKSYKVTLVLALFPLAFCATFGSTLVYVWTGEMPRSLPVTMVLLCLATVFSCFSILGLVLYRVTGRAVLDNIRQVLRIAILMSIALFARQIGFYGVLAGLAASEFSGMLFMLFALTKTFKEFQAKSLVPDTIRMVASAATILLAGYLASLIPLSLNLNGRALAALQLTKVVCACVCAAWPALLFTKSVTSREAKAILGSFLPGSYTRGVAPVVSK